MGQVSVLSIFAPRDGRNRPPPARGGSNSRPTLGGTMPRAGWVIGFGRLHCAPIRKLFYSIGDGRFLAPSQKRWRQPDPRGTRAKRRSFAKMAIHGAYKYLQGASVPPLTKKTLLRTGLGLLGGRQGGFVEGKAYDGELSQRGGIRGPCKNYIQYFGRSTQSVVLAPR